MTMERLIKDKKSEAPLPYELYQYLSAFNTPIIDKDNYNYLHFKRSYLNEDSVLIRRQHTLNIVGLNHYKTDAVNFDYVIQKDSYIEGNEYIAKEIQQEIHQFFGFLIYTYVPIDPKKIVICHYPDSFSAYAESLIRYEWTYQQCYTDVGNGYTLPFFTFNPNRCVIEGFKNAITNKSIPDEETYTTYKNMQIYPGKALKKYREICLIGNTQQLVKLHSMQIDPKNPYGVKTFNDLITHIKKTKIGKSTGTSGESKSIEHMALDWEKLATLLPLHKDKTVISSEILYQISLDQETIYQNTFFQQNQHSNSTLDNCKEKHANHSQAKHH